MAYATQVHSMLFGIVAFIGSVYCFLYADGVPETTWFHCNFYKLHMFDSQKYFNSIAIGYFIFYFLISVYR